MANKQKISTIVINNVLAFIKPFASKTLSNDIRALLQPCCIPIVETFGVDSCDSDNTAWGVKFTGVTITDGTLKNKTVTLIVTSTEHGGGAIQLITLDENGSWTGDVQTSWWNSSGTELVKVLLIADGSSVVHTSEVMTLTSVSNCN